MKRIIIGGLVLALFQWNPSSAGEEKESPETPGLYIGVVHKGAIYAADSSLAVHRGDVFGKELRVHRIGPFNFLRQIHESIDFPPCWKLGHGMLTLVNANPGEGTTIYGYHARGIHTYPIPLADIEKRLAEERPVRPPKKDDPLDLSETLELGDGEMDDKADNPLQSIYVSICWYVNYRDKVSSEDHPFSNYEFFYDLIPVKRGVCDYVVLASEPLQEQHERLEKEAEEKPAKEEKPRAVGPPASWEQAAEPMKPMIGFWHKATGGRWALVERIKDPCFNERFHIFPDGTTYYFVTDSGKVYVSKKPCKGERKIEELWVNKKRPINGAITDTASGKTFLFGAERNDSPKLFYFELSEKPELCEFERKAMVDTKKLPLPLEIPTAYAHVLLADKKIKIEKKLEPKP